MKTNFFLQRLYNKMSTTKKQLLTLRWQNKFSSRLNREFNSDNIVLTNNFSKIISDAVASKKFLKILKKVLNMQEKVIKSSRRRWKTIQNKLRIKTKNSKQLCWKKCIIRFCRRDESKVYQVFKLLYSLLIKQVHHSSKLNVVFFFTKTLYYFLCFIYYKLFNYLLKYFATHDKTIFM